MPIVMAVSEMQLEVTDVKSELFDELTTYKKKKSDIFEAGGFHWCGAASADWVQQSCLLELRLHCAELVAIVLDFYGFSRGWQG
jgi:hypothetical protein